MMSGTVKVFLAEALLLPTGIVTAGFLTRQLEPTGYGLLVLASTIVTWIGWSITSAFTRTTIKFVGEAEDWRPVGATVLQLHLWLGSAAVLILWLVADPVSAWLKEPLLAQYLRLAALEIPIFCLSYVHRSILVGLGQFTQRAIATAARWIVRLILIVALVAAGLSVFGAILGSVGAALVELLVCRLYVRPSLFGRSRFPVSQLWGYTIPLFLFALSSRLYEKLDLFALKLLGGTAADAGFYGAAQNLALVPGIFSLAFGPLLLSTLTRTLRQGDLNTAKQFSQDAMRLVLLLLPFMGLSAGAAPEIILLIYSDQFLPAAPLFAWLIVGSVALAMIAVTSCILTAASKPNWPFVLTAPMVPLALLGNWLLIPSLGAVGAAITTTAVATLGALATVLAIYRLWGILPPVATIGRSLLLSGVAYGLASAWMTPGWLLLLKLTAITVLIPIGLWLLREFSPAELALGRSLVTNTWDKLTKQCP
jgi:O-antigen/teichoic acid export membrane protein